MPTPFHAWLFIILHAFAAHSSLSFTTFRPPPSSLIIPPVIFINTISPFLHYRHCRYDDKDGGDGGRAARGALWCAGARERKSVQRRDSAAVQSEEGRREERRKSIGAACECRWRESHYYAIRCCLIMAFAAADEAQMMRYCLVIDDDVVTRYHYVCLAITFLYDAAAVIIIDAITPLMTTCSLLRRWLRRAFIIIDYDDIVYVWYTFIILLSFDDIYCCHCLPCLLICYGYAHLRLLI